MLSNRQVHPLLKVPAPGIDNGNTIYLEIKKIKDPLEVDITISTFFQRSSLFMHKHCTIGFYVVYNTSKLTQWGQ